MGFNLEREEGKDPNRVRHAHPSCIDHFRPAEKGRQRDLGGKRDLLYLANSDLRPRGLEVHLIIHVVKMGGGGARARLAAKRVRESKA